jgi:dUTPase
MAERHHEQVAPVDRVAVPAGIAEIVPDDNILRWGIAERALHRRHAVTSRTLGGCIEKRYRSMLFVFSVCGYTMRDEPTKAGTAEGSERFFVKKHGKEKI